MTKSNQDINDKKSVVVEILTEAFDTNITVNYIVKQDKKRVQRIKALMNYAFDMCQQYGHIYLSKDENACALVVYPHKRKFSFQTLYHEIKLCWTVFGLGSVIKILQHESIVRKNYPVKELCHLLFLGVKKDEARQGLGTQILRQVIESHKAISLPVYIETSMKENVPFYERNGFEVYKELYLPHPLYLIKQK